MNKVGINNSNLNFHASRKQEYATKLNLVALMDIFTILVFFLLLSSGDANKLESAKFVKLPNSTVGTAPHVDASIIIGETDIWLNSVVVAKVDDVINSTDNTVKPLAEALNLYLTNRGELTNYEKENGLSVTILGDQTVSYSLLERVMATCNKENFREISLAVNQVISKSLLSHNTLSSVGENLKNVGGQ